MLEVPFRILVSGTISPGSNVVFDSELGESNFHRAVPPKDKFIIYEEKDHIWLKYFGLLDEEEEKIGPVLFNGKDISRKIMNNNYAKNSTVFNPFKMDRRKK